MIQISSHRSERGFTLIELAIVLAVSATLFSGLWRLMSGGSQQLRDQTAATQHQQVISAAKTYLASSTGQSWMMALTATRGLSLYLPTSTGSCSSTPCLADFLPSGFTKSGTTNSYGQTYQDVMLITSTHDTTAAPRFYAFMVLTASGTAIPDSSGGRIASLIGGDGGFVYSNTDICSSSSSDRPTMACGAYGAWEASTTSLFGFSTSTGGHIASRTYVSSDQDSVSPWLARILLSGNTAYNTMMTDLYMTGTPYSIYLSASPTTTGGTIFMRGGCISGTSDGCLLGSSATIVGGKIENIEEAYFGSSVSATTALTVTATGTDSTALQVNGNQQVTGSLHAANFLYTSDLRMKNNVKPLEGSLEKIAQLNPVSFNFKGTNVPAMGLIAQDLEKIYPNLVKNVKGGYKGVDYVGLVAPLIGAVQELQHENKALRERLDALEFAVKKIQADQ